MKQLIFKSLGSLARIWGKVYTYSMSQGLHNLRTRLYSEWMCASSHGRWREVRFVYPVGYIYGAKYINLGKGVTISRNSVICAYDSFEGEKFSPSIEIGDGARLGEGTNISCIDSVKIGRNVLFGRRVTVNDNNHGDTEPLTLHKSPMERTLHTKGGIVIGDNVWIGDKATILSGVTIGEGAVVGANSVVTKDVEPYTVVGGIPARRLK